jgi:hypothetical protein
MAAWTPGTTGIVIGRQRGLLGKHRAQPILQGASKQGFQPNTLSQSAQPFTGSVVDLSLWQKYALAAKKATGPFIETFVSSLFIPPVSFVGGLAHIPAGGLVATTSWAGLGFAESMINSSVPDTVARTWEAIVGSSVDDYFRSFQIYLTYPSFNSHPTPYAGPLPNVPATLSQGFSGALHLVLAPVLACSLQSKLAPLVSVYHDQLLSRQAAVGTNRSLQSQIAAESPLTQSESDSMKSATSNYASWFADRLEQGLKSTLIQGITAQGPVMGQFAGPVQAILTAEPGFLAGSPVAAFFADWMA